MSDKVTFKRNDFFVHSFQIEGLCMALRQTISLGLAPGPTSISILKSLRDRTIEISSGQWLANLPEVHSEMNAQDVLTVAEVLRTSVLAFLSPEELQEQRGTFGFHSTR
jgi:hypothetical protein